MNQSLALSKPWAAFAWTAIGAGCMAITDLFLKQAALFGVEAATAFALASPVGLMLLMGVTLMNGGWRKHLTPSNPRALMTRGLLMGIMSYISYAGYTYNPYAQQVMILQLAPIIAGLLSVIWLKEAFTKHQLLVAIICLIGIWFIVDPRFGSGTLYLLIPAVAAFFGALGNVYISRHRDKATPIGYSFYGLLMIAIFGWVIHFVNDYSMPSVKAMLWLQLMGCFAVIGVVCISKGFQLAGDSGQTGKVALMFYLQMPIALIIGIWVYSDRPSVMALLGASLVIAAGISLPLRQGISTRRS